MAEPESVPYSIKAGKGQGARRAGIERCGRSDGVPYADQQYV